MKRIITLVAMLCLFVVPCFADPVTLASDSLPVTANVNQKAAISNWNKTSLTLSYWTTPEVTSDSASFNVEANCAVTVSTPSSITLTGTAGTMSVNVGLVGDPITGPALKTYTVTVSRDITAISAVAAGTYTGSVAITVTAP